MISELSESTARSVLPFDDSGLGTPSSLPPSESSGIGTLEFDIPVITSEVFVAYEGLEVLDTYSIYRNWMDLSPEDKKKYRRYYQKALEPRSLVYINKTNPGSIPKILRLQFNKREYDWEEMDLVKTLEKMYFVYEPRYWRSYQSQKFKVIGGGSRKPLFMAYINWNKAKINAFKVRENFGNILDWLENLDVPHDEAYSAVDGIRDLVRERGAYIDPKTGKMEPKISLWVFFTQDQDPKRYTKGKFRVLSKDKTGSLKSSSSLNIESLEDVNVILDDPKVMKEMEELKNEIEIEMRKSITERDTPETIGKKRETAYKRFLFEKPGETVFDLGKDWKFERKDKNTEIIYLQGKMPIPKSRKRGAVIPGKAFAALINLDKLYEKDYLVPPRRRSVTVIASKEDLDEAISELQEHY